MSDAAAARSTISACVQARWDAANVVIAAPPETLDAPLVHLAQGEYGVVSRATMSSLPVVVKKTTTAEADGVTAPVSGGPRAWPRELVVGVAVSALVVLGVCPNFCMLYRSRVRTRYARAPARADARAPARVSKTLLVLEPFDYDLGSRGNHCVGSLSRRHLADPTEALSFTFQALAACCALAGALGVASNDAYPRNFYARPSPEDVAHYVAPAGTLYSVRTRGTLYVQGDFSIATGEALLGRSHARPLAPDEDIPRRVHLTLRDMLRKGVHVTSNYAVPPLARDAAVVLVYVLQDSPPGTATALWAHSCVGALQEIIDGCGDGGLGEHACATLIERIFAADFLRDAGMPLDAIVALERGADAALPPGTFVLRPDAETAALVSQYVERALGICIAHDVDVEFDVATPIET
jgi:hypothetical protein